MLLVLIDIDDVDFKQGILNLKVASDGSVISESHIAHVTADGKCALSKIPNTETRVALLANLFYSEGKPGKVLRVQCKHRIGTDNFISSCRKIVAKHYAGKVVGRSIFRCDLNSEIIFNII